MTSYPSEDPGPAAVRSPLGTLLGQHGGHGADAVRVFRGVRHAVPPLGARRCKHAEPVRGRRGERLAVAFGPECPQPPFSPDYFYYRPAPQASEHCPSLNVWAPAERDEPLPVMVWIHGGSLVEGAGSSPAYDGTALAQVREYSTHDAMGLAGLICRSEVKAAEVHTAALEAIDVVNREIKGP